MKTSDALKSRISCRAFLPDPIPQELVHEILDAARYAPSGGNLQPWHVMALSGQPLAEMLADVQVAMQEHPKGGPTEYRVYPKDLKEPYFSRRHKCGEDLYATINVTRDDRAGRLKQFKRNFQLFDAPVGLFIYIDRTMGPPQWSDVGMFLQSIMLVAREKGLHTCAQEAWAMFHTVVDTHLNPPADHMLFCGIGLGYMDTDAPINSLRTDRAEVEDFTSFMGFQSLLAKFKFST